MKKKIIFGSLISLQITDILSTYIIIEMLNGYEKNPFPQLIINQYGYIALTIITLIVTYIAYKHIVLTHRYNIKVYYFTLIFFGILYILPVINNLYVILSSI